MVHHRWPLFGGALAAIGSLTLALSITLISATKVQQHALQQHALTTQAQLASLLAPAIAYYDTAAIKRITGTYLATDVSTMTLTDHFTAEQTTWVTDRPETIPHWYDDLLGVQSVTLISDLSHDGTRVAQMAITLDAGPARQALIEQLLTTLVTLMVALSGCALFFSLWLWRKQSAIGSAARTIQQLAQQDFASAQSAPRSGFRPLDMALDTLSQHIQRLIQSLHNELKTLHNDMMYDTVSGLPNRQYFTHQLTSWMSDNDDAPGAVLIADMRWLDTVYRHYGYVARDETWRLLASSLTTAFATDANVCIARISESEIALLIPARSEEQSRQSLHTLISTLNNELNMAGFEQNQGFHIGAVHGQGLPASQLLSLADNALQRAAKQNDVFVFNRGSEEQVIDRETWRELLTEVMEHKAIRLQVQPVTTWEDAPDAPLHLEVFTQAWVENKWQSAGRLMPYIQLFDKGVAFDRMVIEHLAEHHRRSPFEHPMALNLTDESLCDTHFVHWLEQKLTTSLPASLLCIEISEASARNNLSSCITFSEKMRALGVAVGIDHFGRYLQNVEYLPMLKPTYVKLDQALSQGQNGQNRLFTETLANIADSLDITVIATGIKDLECQQRLNRDVIDAYQGFIHPPTLMTPETLSQSH